VWTTLHRSRVWSPRHTFAALTASTVSHQSSPAAPECDSPAANGVTEHEKLTSHVFNLHPHNSPTYSKTAAADILTQKLQGNFQKRNRGQIDEEK
jgi:hypothetical protein